MIALGGADVAFFWAVRSLGELMYDQTKGMCKPGVRTFIRIETKGHTVENLITSVGVMSFKDVFRNGQEFLSFFSALISVTMNSLKEGHVELLNCLLELMNEMKSMAEQGECNGSTEDVDGEAEGD